MQILNYSGTPKIMDMADITCSESRRALGKVPRDFHKLEMTSISLSFSTSKRKQNQPTNQPKASTSKNLQVPQSQHRNRTINFFISFVFRYDMGLGREERKEWNDNSVIRILDISLDNFGVIFISN